MKFFPDKGHDKFVELLIHHNSCIDAKNKKVLQLSISYIKGETAGFLL